ncbi:NAD-dependent epimerase/dehydratase family protein [Pseudobdellovibrio exovorus]|uniref:NAD-dependent epimerase/dehydratase domain-containing protein n=1 Tax=Pseudobdellovibrio exovorus JSS TaxID=1184267 RepID=M4VR89_9BACT|nr:NAD-dependent epimerase/dehydratase family protein [Pseudobdellovibrio exovorus]AGH95694.1 hypothetical protein A11Q_1478 [Pseudobdellovibrio exovorus JSS]
MNSILITGSAGFIGTHLSEHYLKAGYRVYGVDNYLTGSIQNTDYLLHKYPKNFVFSEQDISDKWTLDSVGIQNLKYVFHLASPASVKLYQKFPIETMQANSIGLENSLQFADHYRARLVFSSTSEIYGSPLSSPQKESDWGHVNSFGPRSCYDESKRFGEALIFSYNQKNQTSHGLVRIFNTYGDRMHPNDDRVINSFLQQALKNEDMTIYGDGQQTRSFCYIDDLVAGLVRYAESNLKQPINLGNDHEVRILDLAKLVLEVTGSKSKIRFEPLPQDDPLQRRPDLTLARQLLEYNPNITLMDGLKKMMSVIDSTQL